ncbi:Vacuolar protein-sorting-associated protein 24 [Yamadazyma tenuis]|uniref:Snf7-domain-containing protein n=1 Tax=Candida tenuis (strain ATCC 10573 / BCRC 21748 / CBS 615 / JCM 9827 / NBRC 10315 / NRRL Y-1498 / VKM Y-70) TaxID=590646 RepID=G3BC29_CANTC|nr:uncharacterized protein CANTEDRAFT_116832 [Yamadazyma tenuis ATCC 10573]XP_006690475.1 uncharacterized protein CANTEDRAFT_116832 [Yamadazyma tenuis ATCC 10573]EGV61260.1 hypothetical protein CANTEDRAFT_116832 [Yamadazyma tenuis ATCC 10573]EGV61261.1 hypothetical protein CANTEDRAFT_116832 [Yamadazyma tenuis ATCC 10573]WEJ93960.1 Vacuolar protein-sorting-associated protein 24 [Yamadazyma tenuis]
MDYVKKAIWGPDPKEQMRKINQLLRKNKRELERSMNQLQPLKKKTEGLIKNAAKAKDLKTARLYARELQNINKQYNKLHLSKARVDSINMSINEQYSMNKLTTSMKSSTSVMRDVNQLVHLGVVSGTMQELQKELMKSGIINEMMDDMIDLDVDEDELEDESQQEINKIIEDLTKNEFSKIDTQVPTESVEEPQEQEAAFEEDHEALDEMRQRLRALQE